LSPATGVGLLLGFVATDSLTSSRRCQLGRRWTMGDGRWHVADWRGNVYLTVGVAHSSAYWCSLRPWLSTTRQKHRLLQVNTRQVNRDLPVFIFSLCEDIERTIFDLYNGRAIPIGEVTAIPQKLLDKRDHEILYTMSQW